MATVSNVFNPTVVKADANQPDPNAIKLTLSSKKKYIILKPGTSWSDYNLVSDIAPNHSRLYEAGNTYTYIKNKNGKLSSTPVDERKLKKGDEGIVEVDVSFEEGTLKDNQLYTYLARTDASSDLVWTSAEIFGVGFLDEPDPTVKIPFVVGSKKAPHTTRAKTTHSKKTYGYVTASKGQKVRTYTSKGKFSKHYVYGHHTYRLSSSKTIKGHGKSYKIYGKNQWIPKKYLKLK